MAVKTQCGFLLNDIWYSEENAHADSFSQTMEEAVEKRYIVIELFPSRLVQILVENLFMLKCQMGIAPATGKHAQITFNRLKRHEVLQTENPWKS